MTGEEELRYASDLVACRPPGRCCARISGEQSERNLARLQANRTRIATLGGARQGEALLAGLLHCAVCGHRMTVQYHDQTNRPRDVCTRLATDDGGEICHQVAGRPTRRSVPLASIAWWNRRTSWSRALERTREEQLAAQQQLEEAYHRFLATQPRLLIAPERAAPAPLARSSIRRPCRRLAAASTASSISVSVTRGCARRHAATSCATARPARSQPPYVASSTTLPPQSIARRPSIA